MKGVPLGLRSCKQKSQSHEDAIWDRQVCQTYLATAALVVESTVASSLIRCGRLPVFSSCSRTPITISSLMPSRSSLLLFLAPGEGGGVLSYAPLPLLLGRSANVTDLTEEAVDDRGRAGVVGDDTVEECDRFAFFEGGGRISVVADDLDGEWR